MTGLAGARRLTGLALRRDRMTLGAWVATITTLSALFAAMTVSGLPTQEDVVQETALFAGTPAMRLLGLPTGAAVGGYMLIRSYLTLAVLAALMSVLAVVRHTRQDEETGRAELLGSTVVGRQARLAAALAVTVAADAAVAVLSALAMAASGLPLAGSIAAGASIGAVGLVLGGVAAVTAQLVTGARAASGLAGAVLAVACLVSGIGNMLGDVGQDGLSVTSAWPAWLSPVGWGQQVRPFDDIRWWPLGLALVAFVALVALAGCVGARRDFARGVLPERPGPASGGGLLQGPVSLAWRLTRGATAAWTVGMGAFGLVLGSLADSVTDLEGTAREWYVSLGGTDQIVDAFHTSMVQMAGMAAAAYVVQVMLRMRAEEIDGRVEHLVASTVSRARWTAAHLMHATVGAAALVVACTLGLAATSPGSLDRRLETAGALVSAGLAQLPAVLVLGGLAAGLVGLVPRWSGALGWAALGAAVLLGPVFGPSIGAPEWVQRLSPLTHAPRLPAGDLSPAPMLALTAACVALAVLAAHAVRRRDLVLPV